MPESPSQIAKTCSKCAGNKQVSRSNKFMVFLRHGFGSLHVWLHSSGKLFLHEHLYTDILRRPVPSGYASAIRVGSSLIDARAFLDPKHCCKLSTCAESSCSFGSWSPMCKGLSRAVCGNESDVKSP